MVEGNTLPIALADLKTVHMEVDWTYGMGNDPAPTTDDDALNAAGLNANVAIDMFLDSDETVASNSSKAKYEIMVWFAQYGTSTDPIGYNNTLPNNGRLTTRNVNGTVLFVPLLLFLSSAMLTSMCLVTFITARTPNSRM